MDNTELVQVLKEIRDELRLGREVIETVLGLHRVDGPPPQPTLSVEQQERANAIEFIKDMIMRLLRQNDGELRFIDLRVCTCDLVLSGGGIPTLFPEAFEQLRAQGLIIKPLVSEGQHQIVRLVSKEG